MKTLIDFFKKEKTSKPMSDESDGSITSEFPGNFASIINENLFTDKNPPSEEPQVVVKVESILQNFLDQDFFNNGYQEGYHNHNQDMITSRTKQIKSEFRYIVDQVIETKRTKITELQCQCLDVDEVSDRLRRKLQIHIESTSSSIDKLEKEKELSVGEEGLVMHPIHKYRNGFIRGLELYHEEKFLGESTGFFND